MVCLGFEAKQRFDRSGVTSCLANSSALREQNGLKFGTIVEYNGMVSYDFCQIFGMLPLISGSPTRSSLTALVSPISWL